MYASGLVLLRFLHQLDLAIDDARLRATVAAAADTRIVIVDIDEPACAHRPLALAARPPALADELFAPASAPRWSASTWCSLRPRRAMRLAAHWPAARPVLGYFLNRRRQPGRRRARRNAADAAVRRRAGEAGGLP